jgi:hypothetical protein
MDGRFGRVALSDGHAAAAVRTHGRSSRASRRPAPPPPRHTECPPIIKSRFSFNYLAGNCRDVRSKSELTVPSNSESREVWHGPFSCDVGSNFLIMTINMLWTCPHCTFNWLLFSVRILFESSPKVFESANLCPQKKSPLWTLSQVGIADAEGIRTEAFADLVNGDRSQQRQEPPRSRMGVNGLGH